MRRVPRTGWKYRVIIMYELHDRGHTHRFIAEKLGLDRSTVTYHLNKPRPKTITLPSKINTMDPYCGMGRKAA